MTLFQLLMLGASAFFAYKIYEHIQTLKDPEEGKVFEDPADAELLVYQGDEEMQKGDAQRALTIYHEANIKMPHNQEILFKMGYALVAQERFEEALEYYQEALELNHRNSALHQAIASVYRKTGDYEKAKEHLDYSLEQDNENPITYFNYGNLLVDMQETEAAKRCTKKHLNWTMSLVKRKRNWRNLDESFRNL